MLECGVKRGVRREENAFRGVLWLKSTCEIAMSVRAGRYRFPRLGAQGRRREMANHPNRNRITPIRGGWMSGGYIDNLNRRPVLEVEILSNGDVVLAGEDLHPMDTPQPLALDADGEIAAWGGSVAFSPDAGEIDRVTARGGKFRSQT